MQQPVVPLSLPFTSVVDQAELCEFLASHVRGPVRVSSVVLHAPQNKIMYIHQKWNEKFFPKEILSAHKIALEQQATLTDFLMWTPTDVIGLILSWIDARKLVSWRRVCKLWKDMISKLPVCWKAQNWDSLIFLSKMFPNCEAIDFRSYTTFAALPHLPRLRFSYGSPLQPTMQDVFLQWHTALEGLYHLKSSNAMFTFPTGTECLHFPHLRELTIEITSGDMTTNFHVFALLTRLTSLRFLVSEKENTLRFVGGAPRQCYTNLSTLSQKLTQLHVLHMGIESEQSYFEDVGAFRSLSNLRSLDCPVALIDSCSFPHLRFLSVSHKVKPHHASNILHQCDLPNLRDLRVDGGHAAQLLSISSLRHITRLELIGPRQPCLHAKDIDLPELRVLILRAPLELDSDFAKHFTVQHLRMLTLFHVFHAHALLRSPAAQKVTRLEMASGQYAMAKNQAAIRLLTRLESLTFVVPTSTQPSDDDPEPDESEDSDEDDDGDDTNRPTEREVLVPLAPFALLSQLRHLVLSPNIDWSALRQFPLLSQLELPREQLHGPDYLLHLKPLSFLTQLTIQSIPGWRGALVKEIHASLPQLNITLTN